MVGTAADTRPPRRAQNSPEASRLRATVNQTIADEPPKKDGILAALRRYWAGAIAILSPCGVPSQYSSPIRSAVEAAPKVGPPG